MAGRNFEEQISSLTVQLHEAKKHADNEAEALLQLEELRKRSSKDIESLQGQIEELKVQNDRLEKSKKKLQAELEDIIVDLENTYEDITIDLDSQRAKVIELEKKLRNFDKILAEEKAISERFASERDAAERDAREKETKVLSLSRDLEEYIVKVEELERSRRVFQNELDELANSRGTADKNVEGTSSGDQDLIENDEDERFDELSDPSPALEPPNPEKSDLDKLNEASIVF
ncbi:myosin heavy chain, non-muscle-like [Artemia franciscana]|uniref:myosin heavy chain, non-muscle-like n=1 Tax=Artemia franciscana TaxID=6661 RepID=UPI0032DB08F7